MTTTTGTDVSYDPYDVEINADPYPVFRRLREEAPLYRNDTHDFYALSRFDDVERGLVDRETYISGRGAHPRADQGEHRDAAGHAHLRGPADPHRAPQPAVAGVHAEEDERARAEDPRVLRPEPRPARRRRPASTSSRDLGAQMPMRVIGMLLGIPEEDQEAVRDRVDADLRTEPGKPMRYSQEQFVDAARRSPSTSTGAPSTRPTT